MYVHYHEKLTQNAVVKDRVYRTLY